MHFGASGLGRLLLPIVLIEVRVLDAEVLPATLGRGEGDGGELGVVAGMSDGSGSGVLSL